MTHTKIISPKLSQHFRSCSEPVWYRITALVPWFGPWFSCVHGGGRYEVITGYFTTFLHLHSFPPCFVRSQLLPGMAFLHFLLFFPGPHFDPYILTPLYFIVASRNVFQSIPVPDLISLEYHIDRLTFIRFRVIAV